MEILQEITVWDNIKIPNHSYALNMAGKMVAYRKVGEKDWFVFNRPLNFDKRRRKFSKITDAKTIAYFSKFEARPVGAVVYKSSNGNEYVIHDGKCTCPGFKFRSKCKHVNSSQK